MSSRCMWRGFSALVLSRVSSKPVILNHIKAKSLQTVTAKHRQQISTSSRLNFPATPSFECVNIQDSNDFKSKVLESKIPVVVDFHAIWCHPCKLLGPRLEAIISEKKGKVVLAKVDIDDISELAIEYGVSSVPTVLSFRNGTVEDSFIGLKDDDLLQQFVDKLD